MNNFLKRINRKMSVSSAAVLISGSLAIGFILGFIRTKLIYANFNDFSTGAYFAAFEIPDLIFYTFSGAALSVAFIPVLSDKVYASNLQQAWRLTSSILNILSFAMLLVSLSLILFPRPILELIAPGFSPERLDVAAQIMRFAAINPFVFSITSILSSVQQIFGRFIYFAIAPLFYNLSIILSIYLFKDSMGVVGLGVGVAIGALFNILIFGLGMKNLNFRHYWSITWRDWSFLQVIKALPARSFDQGVVYINAIVHTRIASALPIQALPNLKGALYLYYAPIHLLGMALGTAIFPRFTKHISQNRPDLLEQEFRLVFKIIIWMAIPLVIFSFMSRHYWARIIFSQNNDEIALIFGWLCLGIIFRTLYAIVSRFYYAHKDTLTPFLVAILVLFANIVFSYWLSARYGVQGLGMATSFVAVIEVVALVLILQYRQKQIFHAQFLKDLFLILFAGVVAGLGVYFATDRWLAMQANDGYIVFIIKLCLIFTLTFFLHFVLSYILKLKEAKYFWAYVGRMYTKFKPPFIDKGISR